MAMKWSTPHFLSLHRQRICNYCKYMSLMPPPSGDRRHARREATRQAILDAAEHIVVEEGLEALRSKNLAERAGTSERSVFNHFANLDDVVLARVTSYLTRLLNQPDIPAGISLAELPHAIDQKFRESFNHPEADELFAGFLRLSICLSAEMLDLLGQHILLTLADVSRQLVEDLMGKYPSLGSAQGVAVQMYVHNLTTSIAFGLLHGLYRLGFFDQEAMPAPADSFALRTNLQDNPLEGRLSLDSLKEDLFWAFDHVALGRPRI